MSQNVPYHPSMLSSNTFGNVRNKFRKKDWYLHGKGHDLSEKKASVSLESVVHLTLVIVL